MAAALLVVLLGAASSEARGDDCFEWEVEYHGGGLQDNLLTGVNSPDKYGLLYMSGLHTYKPIRCQSLCQERSDCLYWTWLSSQADYLDYRNTCWLKATTGERRSCSSCVSGPRFCGDPPGPTTAAPPGCCPAVTVSSTGAGPDYQWTRFGVFHRTPDTAADRPIYKQEGGANYIWYNDYVGCWYVGETVSVLLEI